jgi:1,2-diacylglycerol 3-alpha-glucosyltransferase
LIDEILPVLERHPDYRLIIVGDGPDRRRLQQRLRGRRVDRQVRFTGYLDRRETLRWYRAAELFVTASLSENHPMSLIEAQAAGLPVVARRDPGIGTAVRPGQSALLADTDGELGSLCERLLEDAELHRSMSREAERAAESFDIRRHGDRVEALYGRLLSEAH